MLHVQVCLSVRKDAYSINVYNNLIAEIDAGKQWPIYERKILMNFLVAMHKGVLKKVLSEERLGYCWYRLLMGDTEDDSDKAQVGNFLSEHFDKDLVAAIGRLKTNLATAWNMNDYLNMLEKREKTRKSGKR